MANGIVVQHGAQLVVVLIIAVALVFDFTNGFNDAANAIATSVSTRALKPRKAVLLAAVLNLAGAFLTTKVAATVGKGIVVTDKVTLTVVGAALVGAIVWNLIVWRLGLPSSSTHALIGGLIGAMLVAHGPAFVQGKGIVAKVVVPGLVSPLIGLVVGFLVMLTLYWLFRAWAPARLNRTFRGAQVLSAAFVSFSHGANDAQKTMGIITLSLVAGGFQDKFAVPPWVIVASALAIALGTYSGGWRIIRTVGQRIYRLQPISGFAAQTAAATILLVASLKGLPVSTTHVLNSAVMGVGSTRRVSAVRWGVAGNIVIAWVLTIPCAAAMAALVYGLLYLAGAR
jgi:inorganic phosphate transporter, PiT family